MKLERVRTNHETELREMSHKIQEKSDELERARATITEQRENYESVIERLHNEIRQQLEQPKGGASLAMVTKLSVSEHVATAQQSRSNK